MIRSKKELKFYIMADRIMNGCTPKASIKERMVGFVKTNPIIDYLKHMRCASYYRNHNKLKYIWHSMQYRKLGMKLGFSISADTFGYGLVIPHWGTIVVSSDVRAGNYAVLHTSICVGGGEKLIGNNLYISAGAKIFKKLELGDNVTISPNSLVTRGCEENNITLSGCPATVTRRGTQPWYERDGESYAKRHDTVEKIKRELNL